MENTFDTDFTAVLLKADYPCNGHIYREEVIKRDMVRDEVPLLVEFDGSKVVGDGYTYYNKVNRCLMMQGRLRWEDINRLFGRDDMSEFSVGLSVSGGYNENNEMTVAHLCSVSIVQYPVSSFMKGMIVTKKEMIDSEKKVNLLGGVDDNDAVRYLKISAKGLVWVEQPPCGKWHLCTSYPDKCEDCLIHYKRKDHYSSLRPSDANPTFNPLTIKVPSNASICGIKEFKEMIGRGELKRVKFVHLGILNGDVWCEDNCTMCDSKMNIENFMAADIYEKWNIVVFDIPSEE